MAMKNLANCGKVLERVQQTRQFGGSTGKKADDALKMSLNKLHVTAQQSYPVAAALPLPANIDPSETTRFSPQRNRDISAHAILTHHQSGSFEKPVDITVDNSTLDPHIDSYDCRGAVNLNSSMQSNVPSPFGGMHKFTHLNMPGGQWSQDSKFMSHNLQNSHYTNLRREARAGWSDYDEHTTVNNMKQGTGQQEFVRLMYLKNNKQTIFENNRKAFNLHELTRHFSTGVYQKTNVNKTTENTNTNTATTSSAAGNLNVKTATTTTVESSKTVDESKLSRKEQLKRAFKEYGATIIVFHVGISLASLGACYLLVDRGIDVMPFLEAIGFGSSTLSNKIATGASTFVIAYAIHKVFAPVRISITLGSAPFIVRYLRSKGILKVKKQS